MTDHNEQPRPTPLLLSQTQAAQLLGDIHRTTLWRMVKRGELRQVNIGRRAFIESDSVEFYVARLAGRAGDSCGNVRPLAHGGRRPMPAHRRANGEGSMYKRQDGRYVASMSYKDPTTGQHQEAIPVREDANRSP